jgi:hypothetical protein
MYWNYLHRHAHGHASLYGTSHRFSDFQFEDDLLNQPDQAFNPLIDNDQHVYYNVDQDPTNHQPACHILTLGV